MLTNFSLKLIVLLHDKNLKFLEPKDQLTESQPEQPTAEIKPVCKSGPAKRKLATSGSQTGQMDVITCTLEHSGRDIHSWAWRGAHLGAVLKGEGRKGAGLLAGQAGMLERRGSAGACTLAPEPR